MTKAVRGARRRTKRVLAVLSVAVGALLLSALAGAWRWQRASRQLERVVREAASPGAMVFHADSTAMLPPPVARFFRHVLRHGQPFIRSAQIRHDGTFQMGTDERGWRRFESQQTFASRPAGFVWDATIRYTPLTPVYVRDALVGGKGSTRASILGLITVADQHDARGLDAGAAQRWLAETMWFPTALLPGGDVTWSAIDDRRALATLAVSDTVVSLEFRFNDADDVVEVFAPSRAREVNGTFVPTPWIVRCTAHREWHNVRVPSECAVAWQLTRGELTYWRGRVTDVRYTVFGAQ